MEDRQPAGLWLELLRGADPTARASELASAGLLVSSWETDPYPELPRRLDHCDGLLIGESATASYDDVPTAAESSTVVPLRRYPRPSQGFCTGEPTTGLLIVLFSSKTAEQVQALRDWADFVHLRWIAAARVPGYTTITPYEHVSGGTPRFCHVYEMTTDDPRSAYESMTPLVAELLGRGTGSEVFDDWAWHPALLVEYVNTFRRVS